MKRTQRLGLVLSPEEKRAAERLAERRGGLSVAALIRLLIRREARVEGLWPLSSTDEEGLCQQK
jgi:hypothetical protein